MSADDPDRDPTPDADADPDGSTGSTPSVPDVAGPGSGDAERADTTAGVRTVTDPRKETPLTEDFRTGTANDPPLDGGGADGGTADGPVSLRVDGREVTVDGEATLLDALEAAGRENEVSALCNYDRDTEASDQIGPRTTCQTCAVEADGEVVPSCSYPVRDGMRVRTGSEAAAEARSVNLDLVLSNHNLRCTTCGKNGRCELQDASIEADVEHPRYGVLDDRDAYEPVDDTSPFIQIDRNKCILCNRCVEACNDVQVQGVLRVEDGSDGDPRIGFMSDAATMEDSTCVSCGHCATVCPTGSLVEKGLVDETTLPIPGFTQKNSVGEAIESDAVVRTADQQESFASGASVARAGAPERSGVAGFMQRAKRQAGDVARNAGMRAFLEGEHAAEWLAAKSLPEGRLFDIATLVARARSRDIEKTETTCGYCAVGCRFEVWSDQDENEVLGVRATDPDGAPANDFSTCVKGKFGYDFTDAEDRLETPLVRENGRLRPATWDEALSRVADEFESIREEHGPEALACFASSKCTNEEDYLMQKFARGVLGTPNVDNCARLCHSSTVAALKQTVGFGAMSNSIRDVANADAYLITGSNTTESHPVLATRIKQNVRDGSDLVVFDPRKNEIGEHADQYVRTRPGYDVAWLNGLTRYVIEQGYHDEAFIEERTKGFEDLREKVEPFTPERVEELAGVPADELERAGETLGTADSVVFGWAMGMTQHTHGTANVQAVADLALALGQVGKPNAGLSPFRGHNNVQGGGGDMGTLPNVLPGYLDVTDSDVLDDYEAEWGARPPDEVGLTVPETVDAMHVGDVKGLYVMGENPALSEPDISHAEEALDECDFLVVQDLFPTETAEYADVVLPAASFAEKEGTFTNTERRVQLVGQAIDPPGDARQDWAILQDLSRRIDHDGDRWSYDSPAEVMDEIADLAPIYGGISHDRLEREGGLQWPCRNADDPGTRFLYEDGFNFDDGKARFVPADSGHPDEVPGEEYPLTLTSGRVLYHFHTGTLTRRQEGMMRHAGESYVEIHPETASAAGVADGDRVTVESPRGRIAVTARVTDRVGEGVVFVPMHFAAGAVNRLTNEAFDPTSGIPEYKVSSVRLAPAPPEDGDTAGATVDD
jgi:formate dehydrogenase major subunit